jgi:DNA repair exonuclease SbcCD ATPase subunit
MDQVTKQDPTKLKKKSDGFIADIDKNMVVFVAVAGVSIGLSFYLFKELKKLREEVKTSKSREIPDNLIEQVELNSQSVRSIELKLDQLLLSLSQRSQKSREYRESRPKAVEQPVEQVEQVEKSVTPPPVDENDKQEQRVEIPFLGGRIDNTNGVIKI